MSDDFNKFYSKTDKNFHKKGDKSPSYYNYTDYNWSNSKE